MWEQQIARERERDMCVSATIDDVPQTEAWAVVAVEGVAQQMRILK